MKFTPSILLAVLAAAAPTNRAALNDMDILQYALTLEHLENVFYKGGLSQYTEQDFLKAGFSSAYYNNLKYVAHDEEQHVEALTAALSAAGASPVAACEYSFPYTDPKSFVALASILEGVGDAAYLGGAPLITSKAYLGVAGAILVAEALHTAVHRFNLGEVAPANPYGSALGVNEVYTLAGGFIKSCPSTNAMLPLMAFPNLVSVQGQPTAPNVAFNFEMPKAATSGSMFVTFVSGLVTASAPATVSGGMIATTIPMGISGQSYAILTNQNVTGALMDSMVIAGPAILEVTPSSPTYSDSIQ